MNNFTATLLYTHESAQTYTKEVKAENFSFSNGFLVFVDNNGDGVAAFPSHLVMSVTK